VVRGFFLKKYPERLLASLFRPARPTGDYALPNLALALAFPAACLLPACTPGAARAGSHPDCAALISAANHLSAQGQLETDADFSRQILLRGMTRLNS
jgi:hypothetical protein